jgi:hypothetical protein
LGNTAKGVERAYCRRGGALRRVIENGRVYLSNASIRGDFALRACFVNHRTQDADVAEIVPQVLRAAHSIIAAA